MGLPSISIVFKSVGTTAIKRGDRGVVALILKDAVGVKGVYTMYSVADIPAGLSTANKNSITQAFMGGVNAPAKVIAYVEDTAVTGYANAESYLETVKFDYLAVPGITSADATAMATWVKSMRDSKGRKVKAVLPETAADSEGVINFASNNVKVGASTFAAKDFTARIAGLLAGTPLTTSATYQALTDVTDCTHLTNDEVGTAIDAGELVVFHDGEKVKIARAVNSLQTLGTDKGEEFKKIKIVDILDMIFNDIKRTAEDNYVGKKANSYENKCLLVNAINGYFEQLEIGGMLERGVNKCQIDVEAQKAYLKSIGMDVDAMKDVDIKTANTKDKVFLTATVKPLDAMEDITLTVNL